MLEAVLLQLLLWAGVQGCWAVGVSSANGGDSAPIQSNSTQQHPSSSTPPPAHVCVQVVLQWINELVSASDGLCALVGAQLLVPHRHNWIHDEGDGMCV